MSNEIKLPETVEEYQQARREAFVRGATWQSLPRAEEPTDVARRRYPIRVKVPRVVELPETGRFAATDHDGSGDVAFYEHEDEARAFAQGRRIGMIWIRGADKAVVADLLANPYEERDE